MFLTQEKALKKIAQERARGELQKARKRALDALKRWPEDFDLAVAAFECCIDLGDNPQAASILKSMLRQHPSKRKKILELASSAYFTTSNPIIGGFLTELLVRSREIEAVEDLLGRSPESFVSDLIRRARTRRQSFKEQGASQAFIENNLLLALCLIENNEAEEAVEPLKEILEKSTEDPTCIGRLLLKIEQRHPRNAGVKYCLGLVSLKLKHTDRAIPRLFQSLDCDEPPVDEMLKAVESIGEGDPRLKLIKGELLILKGEIDKGCSLIRGFIEEMSTDTASGAFQPEIDGAESRNELELAASRVEKLFKEFPGTVGLTFLYADIFEKLGNVKEGIKALETLYEHDPSSADQILSWLERDDEALLTAPSKKLLARIHLEKGNFEKASIAARMAAEMDNTVVVDLVRWIEQKIEQTEKPDPILEALLAEIASIAKDKERAEEILSKLMDERLLEDEKLFSLARTIMKNCGISVEGVNSALEACFAVGKPLDALPHLIALYRESPDEHEALATGLSEIASKDERFWEYLNELIEALSKEEKLSFPMKSLQARVHLKIGEIERAIFEFDQLSMINSDIRFDLINIYEEAAEKHPDNATLQLALYHLNLDLELYPEAARHLCRTLELDPQQIKDIVPRFEKLVSKDPGNRRIWEEMLEAALNIRHTTLAREILKKALDNLPEEESAALHIYGSRIYSSTGNTEDSLKCLAVSLTSPNADLRGILDELEKLVKLSPSNPEVHFLLGETLLRMDMEEKSIESYRKCISLSTAYREPLKDKLEKLLPLSSKPYLISGLLGEVYWAEGDRDTALRFFLEAQKCPQEYIHTLGSTLSRLRTESPEDSRLAMLSARNLMLEERFEESVSILEGMRHRGDIEKVTSILSEILERNPTQPEANRLYTQIFLDSHDTASASRSATKMISDEKTDPRKLCSMVDEFVEIFEGDADFLTAYAVLKARMNDHEDSLRRFEEALRIDREKWNDILEKTCNIEYEGALKTRATLLRTDCLISGKKYDEATSTLTSIGENDLDSIEAVLSRVEKLISSHPSREIFTFGCSLLASKKGSDEVLSLAERGFKTLTEEDIPVFKVEVAEILERKGFHRESVDILDSLLAESEDRNRVYLQIEKAHRSWISSMIEDALEAAEKRSLNGRPAIEAVEAAVDAGLTEEASRLIDAAEINPVEKTYLKALIRISRGKPFDALLIVSSIDRTEISDENLRKKLLYIEGKAAEEISDFGRAYNAFAKIIAIDNEFLDSLERAKRNYVRFIEESTGTNRVLVKCDEL